MGFSQTWNFKLELETSNLKPFRYLLQFSMAIYQLDL
jgi:hypothetical protein